ncbi:MAG: ATP-binding protein [Anaerolineales bacterium]|nr:ATP-binding protein [Anaerolineales bacterium]
MKNMNDYDRESDHGLRSTIRDIQGRLRAYLTRWPASLSLRSKLIIPYVLLTLILASVGVFIVTRLVSSSIQERFNNQLAEVSRVAADSLVRQEDDHLEVLRILAFMDGVPQSYLSSNVARLNEIFAAFALNNEIEAISAVDVAGKELITVTYDPESQETKSFSGSIYANITPVQNVLQGVEDDRGDKFSGLIETNAGKFMITAAPVRSAEGDLVGAVWAGTRLDTLIVDMKLQALADLMLLDREGHLIATTFGELEMGSDGFTFDPALFEQQGSTSVFSEIETQGREYAVLYSPFRLRDQPTGYLGVALPTDYIISTLATSRNSFTAIFTIGTLSVVLVGYLLAQHISRPILQLRSISQAVAGGDLEQYSGVDRHDEIGELANAFDIMTLRLRERTQEAARLYEEAVERNKELAEINARLQAAQAQLIQSEKLGAVGQLTAGIVHDIKNPLAVIKGLAEEAAEAPDLDEFTIEALRTIRESATRANTIVTDLLKFARQSTPLIHRRDLRDTIQAVFRLTEYLMRKGHVTLHEELPGQPVMATYDAQQIEQVLINLVTNAIQAMPDGGNLFVNLEHQEDDVRISVRDEGIGIPEENLGRIFDPFYTTKPEGEGTGLGLSVSYGIISQHGGKIEVESEVGQGTTFTIKLPAAEDSEVLQTEEDVTHFSS